MNPNYSPSLLLDRFFVQNQIPEYVGAAQNRFAWSICLVLYIFYLLVLDPQMTPIKILICALCEIIKKEKIQTFNLTQKLITVILIIMIFLGLYNFSVHVENRSSAMAMMPMMLMSPEDRMKMNEAKIQALQEAEFEKDDEDEEETYVRKCGMKSCTSDACSGGK